MRACHLIVTFVIGCGSESKPTPAPAEPPVVPPTAIAPDAAAPIPDAADEEMGGILGDAVGESSAGSAIAGSGTSAGGSTVASKGPRQYGTIGHGAGTGTGIGYNGRTARRATCPPTVAMGLPSVQGDLDKAIIRRYIKRNLPKLSYCYEKQLLVSPTLSGTLRLTFAIGPAGTVTSSTAQGIDDTVSKCAADVIRGIEFPKPKADGSVQVNYPLTMRSTCR